MDPYKLLITGQIPLVGETYVSGGKNTSVAVIPATLLSDEPCTIENLPDIEDVHVLKDILPDLVIMDPPRSGCSDLFLNTVCSMSPKKLLYISCNPESLARDLQSVLSRHYHVDAIIPVDMFPGTQHVETVVLMSHKDT